MVTARIIAALDAGTIPWQKTWCAGGGVPRNLVTGREYRGINVLLLALGRLYQSPWWLTRKQAERLHGEVRQGEVPSVVTFWMPRKRHVVRRVKREDWWEDTYLRIDFPLIRCYDVFNIEQCEGIQAPAGSFQPEEHERIPLCEAVVAGMPRRPKIIRDPVRAFCSPACDIVAIPDLCRFKSPEEHYSTLFHEPVHSTGHEDRLRRRSLGTPSPFGSPDYSQEELVAEFGAALRCAQAGIFPLAADNQAAYIQSWLTVLRNDRHLLPRAAAQAQHAADYILQRTRPGRTSRPGSAEEQGSAPEHIPAQADDRRLERRTNLNRPRSYRAPSVRQRPGADRLRGSRSSSCIA